jgi:hypothetical protein
MDVCVCVCVCNVCVKCVCVCVCVCEREFVVSIFFHKHRKPVSWGLLARASARTRARKLLNSGPFIKILLHNHSVIYKIIFFFFR